MSINNGASTMAKQSIISRYIAKFVAAPTLDNAETLAYRIKNFPNDRAKLTAEEKIVLDDAIKLTTK
jgi:hypothetical protein